MMTDIEQLSNKQDTLCCEKEEEAHFSFTFNIEILRVYGYLYFVTLFMIAIIITATEVNFPGGSPQYTEMYKMFGFSHLCMAISFNPAKQVGALLLPGFIVPTSLFVALSYFHTKKDYDCGRIPRWLWRFTQATTPFNMVAILQFGMVFVNGPEQDYGFVAHYVPYLLLQTSFGFLAIQQILNGINTGTIPFEAPAWFAKLYTVTLITVVVTYEVYIISTIAGGNIFEKSNPALLLFSKILVNLYSVLVIGMPTIFALQEQSKDSDTMIKLY
jgi:hypothetical protein